jgi:hypothetical protein
MGSSGDPVSKNRVKVLIPGRRKYILVSGAPTCLGHRSLCLCQQFGGRQLAEPAAPGEFLQVFSNIELIHLRPDKCQDGLAFGQIFPPDRIGMIVEGTCHSRRVGKTVGDMLGEHMPDRDQ